VITKIKERKKNAGLEMKKKEEREEENKTTYLLSHQTSLQPTMLPRQKVKERQKIQRMKNTDKSVIYNRVTLD